MWSIIRGTTLVADLTLVPSHAMKVCCCCIPVSIWTCTAKHAKSSGTPWESGCRNPFASSPLCSSCTRKRSAVGCAWLSLSGPFCLCSLRLRSQACREQAQRLGLLGASSGEGYNAFAFSPPSCAAKQVKDRDAFPPFSWLPDHWSDTYRLTAADPAPPNRLSACQLLLEAL